MAFKWRSDIVRQTLAVSLALILISFASTPARAVDLTQQVNFSIPPQRLSTALLEFSHQAKVQVIVGPEVGERRTDGVSGTHSIGDALIRLLGGSSLIYRVINDTSITIGTAAVLDAQPGGKVGTPPGTTYNGAAESRDHALARVDQGQTSSPSSVAKQGQQATGKKSVQLEEVIVTGSRLPDFAESQSQPVRSYTREDISQSGRTTIADFLNTLPDASISSHESGDQTFLGQTTVQLHGLPVGTTLVLLNGRRLEAGVAGFFDLSSVPASAVERIDVLPVGSSAVYGSDALAGAVNIILRRNMDGVEVDLHQGHASNLNETNFNASWGSSGERGSIGIVATYQHRGELLGSERMATSTTALPANAPNLYDVCSPGNIYSLDGTPLPGLGTATQAGIPAGLSGRPSTQAFLATAGTVNLCNSAALSGRIPPTRREGALIVASYQLPGAADLFLETLLSHEQQFSRAGEFIALYGGSFGAFTIGGQNPYNPFGKAVGVSYSDPSSGRLGYDFTHDFAQPLVGVRGKLSGTWSYEASVAYAKDRTPATFPLPNSAAIQAALDSADPATALNPFTSGPSATPPLLRSLTDSAQQYSTTAVNQLTTVQAWLRGPLLNLLAGPVQSVFGGEYSTEREQASDSLGLLNVDLERQSYAFFTEARVPLIASDHRAGGDDRLALNGAARYDHARDFGGKATWQAGLVWRPTEQLQFRGGYAVSYKAPQLRQIGGGIQGTSQQAGLVDPLRGNEAVNGNVLVTYGANSALQPETGKSHALSIVYASERVAGLRAELTEFAIEMNNYIASPPLQTLLDHPDVFVGAIVRAPPSAQDIQQGLPGPITAINDLYYNYGALRVSGVNLDLSCRTTSLLGDWMPSIALSNIYKWLSALSPGSPPVSYLSQATFSGPGFAPRWKATAALAWKRGRLGASVSGRYIGRYRDYLDYVPNTNELGNFWTYDANLHVSLGKAVATDRRWLSGVSMELGAVNLFDKRLPFSFSGSGYDVAEYDIRGRYLYVHLNARF